MANLIRQSLKEGFYIPTDTIVPSISVYDRLKSAHLHVDVRSKIQKKLALDRVQGPFSEFPFQKFKVSPLGVVLKKEVGSFRLSNMHTLSYPRKDSVNDGIENELCSMHIHHLSKP